MTRPIYILFLLAFAVNLFAQNPHGADMRTNCAACHSSAGWEIEAKYWQDFDPEKPNISKMTGMDLGIDSLRFHHGKTNFALKGQHAKVDCRGCHSTLVFSEANSDCVSCHTDMHQQTVGTDCARCHSSSNWLVDNITTLHQENGFPLTGVHQALDCAQCHLSASALQFERIGNDCASCHLKDFNATTNPNHKEAGFSTECLECHDPFKPGWTTDKVNHDFFPLTKGHDISDCAKCHVGGDYSNTPNNCFACHQPDFQATTNPNHVQANFPNDCATCHTTDPDWTPAQYTQHDAAYFPIYSGKHQGQWTQCMDCHQNPSNFAEFSCTNCHINPETDNGHLGVNGYIYENTACYSCHATGDASVAFDHNATDFPLTGAHLSTDCIQCHASGYAGTPTQCSACHTTDFNQAANPNHLALGLPTDCAMCHTTAPGWSPATFPIHNNYYALNGAHAAIANDCATCHNGNYTNTPNTCAGCHTPDYNATTNPNHIAAQFPTDCATCHSESAWAPATFNHNTIYPFTGAHIAIANDCALCHPGGNYTNTPNTCAGCHTPDFTATANPNHVALNLPTDCAMCHTTAPGWEPASFPIHNNYYVLNGAHAAIANDCATCHNGNYNSTPNTCAGCHTPDYNATTNPNHVAAQFPTDCATCHGETAWAPATFDHNTVYPFTGAHIAIANDCALCHPGGNYTNTPNTCAGCHTPDFNATTNPNHVALNLPSDCAMCHTTAPGWEPATFPIHNNYYALNGAHAAIANDCATCHNGNYNSTPNTCAGCHTPDYNATTNPNHLAAQFSTDCATCHSETAWAPSTFNHNTFYPLNGAHAAIANDCALCHIGGNYTNTPNTCAGCHTPDYNATVNPNHVAAQFPTDCATCHSETAWAPSTFNHNTFYPLNGAHAAIANDCALCHVGGNYTNTPNTCAGCHTPDYNAAVNPNHVAAQFPTDCATCHNETGWAPSSFDHNTFYPLIGAHAAIANDCALCHVGGNYANTPNTCAGCHTPDYNGATDPNHVAAQFPTDCAICHTQTAWAPSTFDHNTIYPFTGAHIAIANDCALCHVGGNYTNTPNTCAGCHTPDYNASTNPNHVALAIPTDCAMCHTTTPGWEPATFPIHNNYYALNGAHAAIANDCATCHNGNYNNTPNTCNGCHAADYNGTTDPNHVAAQFPTDCATCHTETAWAPSTFDHNTIYPFTGAHIAIADDCALCHPGGNYSNTPTTCAGCHTPDYNASTNPNHVALAIPTDCAICHTTTPGWEPATFPIHNNYYALNGAHAGIANDCATCHNGDYNNTPNTCFGCHTAEYNGTANPNHITAQFPTDCATCHSETAWVPSNFDHNTIYPFTGAHIAIADDCNACHHGDYNNTPNTCAGCHTPAYNASINPNHVALAIPTDCAMCHTTAPGWEPATFPIHNNYYALNGAHIAIANDCATCHNGDYNNTPNTCFGCHAADYNGTANPNHITAQFPTDCAICHSETAWVPSTFDHNTIYPFTGAHIAIANDCDACHHGDYNNTPNTCAGCHTPAYNASINPNHVALAIPTDCAMCHTTAPGWEPATFPIHNNYYALNGAHIGIANDCATCHHGDYNNTPNTCVGCHQADYNSASDPNHSANQFPTTCQDCHTETAWVPSTFDHNIIYPFTGAHIAIANDCALCHPGGNYNNTPNTCAGCHTPDYNASLNPNHVALVIPTDCAMCHTTEPGWAPATFPIHNNYWPLNGAHAGISNDCVACHNGDYNNTPNTCVGCHQADYNGASDPNHAANQLPTTCQTCHSETAWVPSTFDHNIVYPFTGAHIAIADDCNACHHGNYINVPNTCAGCHTPDYNASLNPKHTALNLPTDCAMCHTTAPGWEPATFPIHNNYWPLNGAHAGISNDCAACHNGNYNNTPNTCVGCHQADYNGASNPNHSANQFPTTCQDCHSETAWAPSTFDHSTIFPFTGAHIPIADDCNACHHGDYNNTPNTCAGCHTPDYNGSSNPNHTALNIPTDCAMCHTTEPDWMPATFPIHDNYWALTGAHLNADCVDCHNGNYNNTPTTCYGCHQTDYNNANNPDHSAAQFPTTCQDCHSTNGWVPSTWNHDQQYFPIYSGKHKNEWDQCIECHTTPGNFSLFSCIDCHEHDDPANMADHHQGVPGYQYSSPACYNCHPDGND